ncbi:MULTISPECIES: oxalurate catabolism protein HpxX [Pantoea]|jgi:hypothetical protein|uniref:Oxalurate catabolism protein HpxX n=1 Tax=Pantoea eucrina TaxID=472693 RepID=A0ABS1ZAU0_9GAMM|nr:MULTISPECIES: oxalurate catabolism protein HpxX [Pantoea]PPS58010.1 DUF4089 domain-containing protein [Pantoea sp. BRM17]AIX50350.1 hypothetical protein PSNIH1_08945 [Pantoea sp. PSNIH1]KAA6047685.1 oxalurate catabolism protein HpxX [Pantoea sp. Bo_7]KAA6092930.1 oxalurate catabolism protein HpxX [Pantoea sp. Bo_10]MBM0749161.1 oxalurate catabolism protein HpxX [Pantoea eucrina]
MTESAEWANYVAQMEQILALDLDDARRAELQLQLSRIAAIAAPLMALPLDDRLEVAGVFQPCA